MNITEKIAQDIADHIQSGNALPFALSHQAIADYYKVSVTPARNAVIALVHAGIIQRKSNGRLAQNVPAGKPTTRSRKKQPTTKPNLDKEWHQAFLGEVITRSLRQNTEYLREEALAQQFGVSRTGVRLQLAQMAGAGLIQHVPRCGWRVRPFDEKEMMDYLRIRELLELEALSLARPHIQKDELQRLLDMNRPARKGSHESALDNRLHAYWIECCGNRYIQEFFGRYGGYYSALFDYASLNQAVMSKMAQEHRDILQHLIDDDWQAARSALRNHIRDQRDSVLRYIDFALLRQ